MPPPRLPPAGAGACGAFCACGAPPPGCALPLTLLACESARRGFGLECVVPVATLAVRAGVGVAVRAGVGDATMRCSLTWGLAVAVTVGARFTVAVAGALLAAAVCSRCAFAFVFVATAGA